MEKREEHRERKNEKEENLCLFIENLHNLVWKKYSSILIVNKALPASFHCKSNIEALGFQ